MISREAGSVMILAAVLVTFLVALVGSFLFGTGVLTMHSGWEETDAELFWLAEAGLQKAIWNLKTPVSGGGQGENWTTAGTTEGLGSGTYTMAVARWNFALSDNGSSANATSTSSGHRASLAIDNDNSTYWESNAAPSPANPQDLIIAFPYPLTINKVRFLSSVAGAVPRDYTWAVSTNGSSYTTVVTVANNSSTDVTSSFAAASNVQALRLRTTEDGTGSPNRVRVYTLEVRGARVTSTGTIVRGGTTLTRTVSQSVVTDDGSPQNQVAYDEPDWAEL